jgi:hypothetical protein
MNSTETIIDPQDDIGAGSGGITSGVTKCYPNGDGITNRPNNDGISPGDIKPYVAPCVGEKPGI